jgi:hypothetical protein
MLFERVFNADLNYTTQILNAGCLGIGSILDQLVKEESKVYFIKQLIRLFLFSRNNKVSVLGAGFHYEKDKIKFIKKLDFQIVRGELSKKILIKNKLIKQDGVLTGDPGLLASYMYTNKKDKKYALGIIPHLGDLNSVLFYEIHKKYKKSVIINVQDHPDKVISEIMECENIISSSLHGLIISDSLNIPNVWVENRYKTGVCEPHFKFFDYYSALDFNCAAPADLFKFLDYDLDYIKINYKIDYNKVQKKQNELYVFLKNYFNKELRK